MKRFDQHRRKRVLSSLGVLTALTIVLFFVQTSQAGICGLSLELFADQATSDYQLGDPVKIMLVIKNDTGFDLNTTRGFSQAELQKGLTLTTPSGEKRRFTDEDLIFDMPPPYFIDNLVGVPAETLPANWVRTVTIEDLRELFPVMRETPGWYTIEAEQEFVRYLWTIAYGNAGLLGVDNDPNACRETVLANRIQVYIAPPAGAQLQVRVMDGSSQPPVAVGQVPVKVFGGALAATDFGAAWTDREPILDGKTDFDGIAIWGEGDYCRPEPGLQYTAIALYGGEYRSVPFIAGAGEGWTAGCGSVIAKAIVFGSSPLPGLGEFSLFATNSIWVKSGAVIESGHLGVMLASPGLWLDSGVEVSIGLNAQTTDGVRIYGDSVKLWPGASVDEVYHNDLVNDGEIRGSEVTPLDLPLPIQMPALPSITPGNKNYSVPFFRTRTLAPGQYRDVSIGFRATLKLRAGVYHFRNLNLGYQAQLLCLGPGPTEIRIKQRMYPGWKAKIGPTPQSGLGAKDVIFYIEGTNGNLWDLFAYPRAAEIGLQNQVKASMVAPNGTIAIDADSDVQGSFIAQGLVVGIGTVVHLESGF